MTFFGSICVHVGLTEYKILAHLHKYEYAQKHTLKTGIALVRLYVVVPTHTHSLTLPKQCQTMSTHSRVR